MKQRLWFALAIAGFVLSLVLEVIHLKAYLAPSASSFCSVGDKLDCATVSGSRYSVLLGVPLPVWGALGFYAVGAAIVTSSRWLVPLSAFAAFGSLALMLVEAFAIGAFCLLCEAVHLVSFVLFALVVAGRRELTRPFGDRRTLAVLFVPPLLAAVAVVAFVPHYWGAFGWKSEPPFARGKTPEGFAWIGAKEPKLTLHEFTDYGCPHCRTAGVWTLRRLSEHPDSLRIVRRQFPRMRCPKRPNFACLALRMAYCAEEQDKFWQADRWLFEHAPRAGRLDTRAFARDLRLDQPRLERCLTRPELAERAAFESQIALDLKLSVTPAYFVNARRVSETELVELIGRLP